MKRLLVDTNVVLDVLLSRTAHLGPGSDLWKAIENRDLVGLLAAHSVATTYYLTRKELGNPAATRMVGLLLSVFGVAAVDADVLAEALHLGMLDFEDAIVAAAARRANCDWIVTRDPGGFKNSPVRALSPEAMLAAVKLTR